MSSPSSDVLAFRNVNPSSGLVPGLNYPRCRRARCRAPQGLSRNQMRSWRRQRASARELGRIHELRLGFDILANVIPKSENEKLSKVQVLRYAMQYIDQLKEMNDSAPTPVVPAMSANTSASSSPLSLDGADWRNATMLQSSDSEFDSDASFFSAASPASAFSFSSSSSSSTGSASPRTGTPSFRSPLPDHQHQPWVQQQRQTQQLDMTQQLMSNTSLGTWMPADPPHIGQANGPQCLTNSAPVAPASARCQTQADALTNYAPLDASTVPGYGVSHARPSPAEYEAYLLEANLSTGPLGTEQQHYQSQLHPSKNSSAAMSSFYAASGNCSVDSSLPWSDFGGLSGANFNDLSLSQFLPCQA